MVKKLNEYKSLIDLKSRLDEHEVQRVLSLSLFQPASPEAITRVVERCRGNEERKLWGITNGEHIQAVVEYYVRDDDILYICNLAVTEECRGQGAGRFILSALQEKYKLSLELETDDDAIGFYRKCGFEVIPFEKYGVQRWKCKLPLN